MLYLGIKPNTEVIRKEDWKSKCKGPEAVAWSASAREQGLKERGRKVGKGVKKVRKGPDAVGLWGHGEEFRFPS